MFNSKRSSKKSRKGKKQNRRNVVGIQSGRGQYAYIQRIGPQLAPEIPREFSVALNVYSPQSFTSVTGSHVQFFGVAEYLAIDPDYAAKLYAIYNYSRITAVKIECTVVNLTAAANLNIGMGVCPYNQTPSMAAIVSSRQSVQRTVSSMGGMDRVKFSKTYLTDDWIGNVPTGKYWQTATQAASATPLDSGEPIIQLVFQPTAAITWSADVTYKLTYHVQFFDLTVS